MENLNLLFLREACINMDKVYFVNENTCDGISYITFYFTNDKSLSIDNCTMSDVYQALRISKEKWRK